MLPGELVIIAGLWAKPKISGMPFDTASLRPGPKSPGRADPSIGTSGTGPSCPGQLVDHGTSDSNRITRESWLTPRALEHRPVAQYRWLNLRALGPGLESPGTSGPPLGPSDTSVIQLGQLVNTEVFWTQAPVARDCW